MFLLRREISRPECAKGFVLDGLPRSPCQAQQLDSFLSHAGVGGIDKVRQTTWPTHSHQRNP